MITKVENKTLFLSFINQGKKEFFSYVPDQNTNSLYHIELAENALLNELGPDSYNKVLNTVKLESIAHNSSEKDPDIVKAVIGREYYNKPVQNENNEYIKNAFDQIKAINKQLFEKIPFQVIFTEKDVYSSAAEMRKRVIEEKVIYIYSGFSGHPFLNQDENNIGRAVHDVYAHLVCGCPFNFTGEYSAYLEQRKHYPEKLWAVLFAEIPAQTAAYYYNKNFDYMQRAIEAPVKWMQLCEGIEKDYSHNSVLKF